MGRVSTTRRQVRPRLTRARLAQLSDAQLLACRLCDLPIKIDNTWVQRCINKLYLELATKGLDRFFPHTWLSTEWFSPDNHPGIAVPFYLVHPRLTEMERSQMLEVEGGTYASCMRILRHEAGHCLDTAYQLHRRKRWREIFGSFTEPYPDSYRPRPGSRHHVLHLSGFYAQAHPAEDFAETFAIWLTPKRRWRREYEGWPALRKLEYVDELMQSIAGTPPKVRSRRHMESIRTQRMTLDAYYQDKHQRYTAETPDLFDEDLYKIFSDAPRHRTRRTAASFLRDVRPELRATVARWTGAHAYTIDQVIRDVMERCKSLNLRLTLGEKAALQEATIMITVMTMNYMQSSPFRISM